MAKYHQPNGKLNKNDNNNGERETETTRDDSSETYHMTRKKIIVSKSTLTEKKTMNLKTRAWSENDGLLFSRFVVVHCIVLLVAWYPFNQIDHDGHFKLHIFDNGRPSHHRKLWTLPVPGHGINARGNFKITPVNRLGAGISSRYA